MADNTRGNPQKNTTQNNPNQVDQKARDQSKSGERDHDRQDPDTQNLKGAARNTGESHSEAGREHRASQGQAQDRSQVQSQGQAGANTRGQPAPGGNRGPDTGNAGQHARTHENAGNTGKQDADKSRANQDRDENDEDRESAEIETKPQTGSRQHMSRDDKR